MLTESKGEQADLENGWGGGHSVRREGGPGLLKQLRHQKKWDPGTYLSECLPALSPSLHCVNMHEDLRGINRRGVHIATAFSISTEKGFNGLIMNRITSPTANYRFLEGEGKESLHWAKVYAADESHGPMFWLTPWSCWHNSCDVALFASLPVISSHFSWIKMSTSVTPNSEFSK